LRALGGALQLAGFEFDDLAGLREGMQDRPVASSSALASRTTVASLTRLASWPIYRSDAVLRRASALSAHPLNRAPAVRFNAEEAARQGFAHGQSVSVDGNVLPLVIDGAVPDGAAWIEAAHDLTATLPAYGASLTLSKA
jgi:NADH-quinone oxidoreductase subunit G